MGPLHADRRHRVARHVATAERAGAVGRVDEGVVREREQLLVQRVVEQPGEIGGLPTERGGEVGAADIADEQRVAGQHGMRRRRAIGLVVDDDGDRLGRVTRRLQGLQAHLSEPDRVAVAQRHEVVLGRRSLSQVHAGADAIAQLEVAGDEVGVEVGQHDVADAQPELRRPLEVDVDVPARVDDRGLTTDGVTDEVRGVGQAAEVELFQDEARSGRVGGGVAHGVGQRRTSRSSVQTSVSTRAPGVRRDDGRAQSPLSIVTGSSAGPARYHRAPMPDDRPPAVGVVVLNYLGATDTVRCLESLRAVAPAPVIVVVDNASRRRLGRAHPGRRARGRGGRQRRQPRVRARQQRRHRAPPERVASTTSGCSTTTRRSRPRRWRRCSTWRPPTTASAPSGR